MGLVVIAHGARADSRSVAKTAEGQPNILWIITDGYRLHLWEFARNQGIR
ncbi:MAG: hypothetical protein K9M45_12790 [Kiritimatiellales bacterium]|nr:hypothetical protein [Kiritimatiellales bacterium]